MPDRNFEINHLWESNRHIDQARQLIADQEGRIRKLEHEGHDLTLAEITLHGFQEGLQTMRQHREIILKTIEQIDSGLL